MSPVTKMMYVVTWSLCPLYSRILTCIDERRDWYAYFTYSRLSRESTNIVVKVEDPLEEVESKNILGSRTRGKQIDFAKAAQELPDEGDDDDEEGDEDFAESSDDEDRMEE